MSNLTGFVKRLRDIMRNDAGINGDAQRIEQIAWMLFLKVYDAKEQDWEWDDEAYQSIIPEECRWQNWAHDDKSGTALTGDRLLDFVNNKLFPTLKSLPVSASTPIKKAIVQTTFADANNYMKDGVLLRQVINVIDDLDFSDYGESHAFGEIYETILKELQSAGSAGEFYTPRAVTDFMAQVIRPKIGETMADFACGTGGFIVSWLKELHKQVKTTEDEQAYLASIRCSLERADDILDFEEAETELASLGLIKTENQPKNKKKESPKAPFRRYECEGFTIIAGRNNMQNERLTKGLSERDIWLHTQKYHSSHVAILSGGREVPESVIKVAAEICAYYSEARGGNKVPVDYTFKKFVKKPSGAKPGFVVYTDYKTALALPEKHSELAAEE